MNIKIYTKPGCKYCTQVKELMQRAKFDYEEVHVNTDALREEFYSAYPSAKTYPYVIIDGEPVGGLVETAKLFVVKGLVSSR
ncbi:glutaredoxin ribonucleotide reductase nrd [Cyanophage S-RIM44]|uniref:Ribonucleotide reductase n=2 Tax=Vellamovirus TaxID=2733139 RepID=A0A127KNE8_9CAUD|nr:glutaredoxin [Prochlorococcus phage Syn1]AMO43459.1 ribonucleotide reductase [Cyanophage S-RIM44]ADO99320.1 glutaredoxin [Prochlorococcus phage Syn1]AOO11931.1 glutaredoxin ribonucleotide reductase nrd [Cyanophage S-RIM44]AOO12632.1 glutaredoxin ribonucleotide reductase nrd [Cyanophage S-RIM44]AOO12865.1 glutaredoxin ribonucleotide reductase nrd [Cyanophage S-RIM44]